MKNNNTKEISVNKLMRITLIQTMSVFVISFLTLLLKSLGFFAIMTFYLIIPTLILFTLLNIAYNERNVRFQRVMIAAFILFYYVLAIFPTMFFINLIFVAFLSSEIIANIQVRYTSGKIKDYLMAAAVPIITILQIIAIATWGGDRVFNSCNGLNISLFFVSTLIANFAILIWRKWWWCILLGSCAFLIIASYIIYNMFVPTSVILTFSIGLLTIYTVNVLLAKLKRHV